MLPFARHWFQNGVGMVFVPYRGGQRTPFHFAYNTKDFYQLTFVVCIFGFWSVVMITSSCTLKLTYVLVTARV